MLVPTGTASLVLQAHNHFHDTDVSTVAELIATFLFPAPTWHLALTDRHTEEECLQDIEYLVGRCFPEPGIDAININRKSVYLDGGCTFMDKAAARGFLSVVQFLHKHSKMGCTQYAMDHAAGNGHLHVVQWLHENRTEKCSIHAMWRAVRSGNFQVMRYLHEIVGAEVASNAWHEAASKGHLQMLQYLHQIHTNWNNSEEEQDLLRARHRVWDSYP